jgi:hypothetical protein
MELFKNIYHGNYKFLIMEALSDKGVIEVLRGDKPFKFLLEIDTMSFIKLLVVLILTGFVIKLSLGVIGK